MKNIDHICVIVQARLGSERIPNKMLKSFAGTTLFENIINIIQNTKLAKNNFYVSVFEQELKDIANNKNIKIFHRSKKSAESEGIDIKEIYEWWDKLPFTYVILVNGCNPFLKPETIDKFILQYINSNNDGMFGVINKKNYFWNKNGNLLTPWPNTEVMNTKRVGDTYEAAHCLYASRLDTIGKGNWMGDLNDIVLYPMDNFEVFDIDYQWQFDMSEEMYKKLKKI